MTEAASVGGLVMLDEIEVKLSTLLREGNIDHTLEVVPVFRCRH